MPLSSLKRLVIHFNPLRADAVSSRDLLARVHTKKAKASNPKCELVTKIETDPNLAAFLEIEYMNGDKEVLESGKYTSEKIIKYIKQKSKMEMTKKLLEKLNNQPN